MKTILVYVVRHGETTLNADNCFRGKIDVPLNEHGTKDAHQLAFYFAPIEICGIVASGKKRAQQTAKIIAQQKDGIEVIPTENLFALNVGIFSGKPKDEKNKTALEHYINNPDLTIPSGESLNDFKDRIRPCIAEGVELAIEKGLPIILVAHSSVVHEVGDMFHGDHTKVLVEPGGVAAIYIEGGELKAEAIFKPSDLEAGSRADTVS